MISRGVYGLGVGAAAIGLVAGTAIGVGVGIFSGFFTFGLSIPIAVFVFACIGLNFGTLLGLVICAVATLPGLIKGAVATSRWSVADSIVALIPFSLGALPLFSMLGTQQIGISTVAKPDPITQGAGEIVHSFRAVVCQWVDDALPFCLAYFIGIMGGTFGFCLLSIVVAMVSGVASVPLFTIGGGRIGAWIGGYNGAWTGGFLEIVFTVIGGSIGFCIGIVALISTPILTVIGGLIGCIFGAVFGPVVGFMLIAYMFDGWVSADLSQYYDFELDIQDIDDARRNSRTAQARSSVPSGTKIALVGKPNCGKTWLLQKIGGMRDAGNKNMQTPSFCWKQIRLNRFMSQACIPSSFFSFGLRPAVFQALLYLLEAFNMFISSLFGQTSCLLIDGNGESKTLGVLDELHDLRCELCDVLIYVMNSVGYSGQSTLMDFVTRMNEKNSLRTIVVVHNLKHLSHQEEFRKAKEDICNMYLTQGFSVISTSGVDYLERHRDRVNQIHVFLAQEHGEPCDAKRSNDLTLSFLKYRLANLPQMASGASTDITSAMSKIMRKYLKSDDETCSVGTPHDLNIQLQHGACRLSGSERETSLQDIAFTWELEGLALSSYAGCRVVGTSGGPVVAELDLPGYSEEQVKEYIVGANKDLVVGATPHRYGVCCSIAMAASQSVARKASSSLVDSMERVEILPTVPVQAIEDVISGRVARYGHADLGDAVSEDGWEVVQVAPNSQHETSLGVTFSSAADSELKANLHIGHLVPDQPQPKLVTPLKYNEHHQSDKNFHQSVKTYVADLPVVTFDEPVSLKSYENGTAVFQFDRSLCDRSGRCL